MLQKEGWGGERLPVRCDLKSKEKSQGRGGKVKKVGHPEEKKDDVPSESCIQQKSEKGGTTANNKIPVGKSPSKERRPGGKGKKGNKGRKKGR